MNSSSWPRCKRRIRFMSMRHSGLVRWLSQWGVRSKKMAVESVTKISDLNENWPLGSDPKAEGDDHIRNIKKALKATDGGAVTKVVMSLKTTSGTYTKPTDLKFLVVEGVGAGGGAAGVVATAAAQFACASGGGGGSWGRRIFTAAEVGASIAYTIGAAGAGTNTATGGAGGTSEFGSGLNCTLTGGDGGSRTGVVTVFTPVLGGAGGVPGAGWTIGVRGETAHSGVAAFSGAINLRPCGGASQYGRPSIVDAYFGTAGSIAGSNYGVGAGGAVNGASQAAGTGANGSQGILIFTEIF